MPLADDEVFHLVAGLNGSDPKRRFLYGHSLIKMPATIESVEPPKPGTWKGAGTYYRMELDSFSESSPKHAMEAIEEGLVETILSDLLLRPKYYPYSTYRDGFRGAQGIYLAKLSPSLATAFRELLSFQGEIDAANFPSHMTTALAAEFAEGERSKREARFFKRHPQLRAAAIERHGLRCHACNFCYGDVYGTLGEGYIEVHHLDPLSERADSIQGSFTTTLDQVVPLCANCHRMVHRKRPALSMDELRSILSGRASV